jgi:hypothetical protein
MFLKYFVIAVPILMVAFFNPLISFLSIYTYCTSEMLPINVGFDQRYQSSKIRLGIILQDFRRQLAKFSNEVSH